MNDSLLIEAAWAARAAAYAPYSRFAVGAALLTENGSVFSGCNVENLSFGLTLCAERSAVVAAVAAGQQAFLKLAIVAETDAPISPCGACRQVLAEFSPTLPILSVARDGAVAHWNLAELLPRAKTGILNHPREESTD